MKEVKKLWYNSQGELRLLKDYPRWDRDLNKLKSESLLVLNAVEMTNWIDNNNGEIALPDTFADLPGATWEEQRSRVESDEIFYAFIHLPKERDDIAGKNSSRRYR